MTINKDFSGSLAMADALSFPQPAKIKNDSPNNGLVRAHQIDAGCYFINMIFRVSLNDPAVIRTK